MSNTTLVIGESGSGKSSSLRHLDPETTFIINVLDKPLPFRGYKARYKPVTKENPNGNYYATDDYSAILRAIKSVNDKRPEISVLVIDDFQYILANEFMRRASEKGFDRFTDIAQHAWLVIKELIATREDLFCFVLSHSESDSQGRMKCKTIGKMLDDKITLEGMFSTVLYAMVVDSEHKFLVQNDGFHIAKSPIDMFETKHIDNDLVLVIDKMKEYFDE